MTRSAYGRQLLISADYECSPALSINEESCCLLSKHYTSPCIKSSRPLAGFSRVGQRLGKFQRVVLEILYFSKSNKLLNIRRLRLFSTPGAAPYAVSKKAHRKVGLFCFQCAALPSSIANRWEQACLPRRTLSSNRPYLRNRGTLCGPSPASEAPKRYALRDEWRVPEINRLA